MLQLNLVESWNELSDGLRVLSAIDLISRRAGSDGELAGTILLILRHDVVRWAEEVEI